MNKHTKFILTIAVAAILLIAAGILIYNNVAAPSLARREIELGERYLDELDYESAILAFDRALKIDPRNVDAYLGKAEALTALGRADEAIAVLREGYNLTQDVRLAEALAGLGVTVEVTAEYPHEKLEIADPNLEAALRDVIDKPEGDLYLDSFEKITRLTLSNKGITDVTPLAKFTNLVSLNVSMNQISDITPLASLTRLTELNLWKNAVSDIAPLAELPGISILNLDNNPVADFTPLKKMATLTDITLGADGGKFDMSIPEALPKLTALRLSGFAISGDDLRRIAEITDLTSLMLTEAGIDDITPLAKLTGLTSLTLSDNIISDLTPLAGLTNLTHLWLMENAVTDITPLAGLTKITELNLQGNDIRDISALSGMTGMTWLLVSFGTQISDLTPLKDMVEMKTLSLYGNKITDISPLAGMTKLEQLYLSNNQIVDVSPLKNLPKDCRLDLSGNPITDWTPVAHVTDVSGRETIG